MKTKTANKTFAFIFLLLCAGFFTGCFNAITEPVLTGAETLMDQRSIMPVLSEMSEEECVEFIIENGIEIPGFFINYPELGAFVKKIIQAAESNPNVPMAYSYDVTYYFAESIRAFVNEYYGTGTAQRNSAATRSAYSLVDSWVFTNSGDWGDSDGYWDEAWRSYNCYAYSIDKTRQPSEYWPGFRYQPGDFAHTGNFDDVISIYDLALVVKDDLEFLGYGDVYVIDAAPPPGVLEQDQKLICIRRGDVDYHFMKYNKEDGYWYHKPSRTAPLRYKYQPSEYYVWTNELSYEGSERQPDITYDSDIYYIVYSVPPIIGSFDIIFNADKWPRNSGVTMQNIIVSSTGPIGVFTLYDNGYWTLDAEAETLYNYLTMFDPEYDKFADYLKWDIPSEITDYLAANDLMIEIPLTVNLLVYNSVGLEYGSFSVDFVILGAGSGIIGEDDHIVPDNQTINYRPYPITVQPKDGNATAGWEIIDYYDIYFNESNLYGSSYSAMTAGGQFGYGKIGKFALYSNDMWFLSPVYDVVSYVITFNPNTDSFFNTLDWIPNSGTMPTYLSNLQKAAKVPLTVEFPAYVNNTGFLGAYSMEVKISGSGPNLLTCNNNVYIMENSINYAPYQVWVYPAIGVLEADN
jgi:hypothetical protein